MYNTDPNPKLKVGGVNAVNEKIKKENENQLQIPLTKKNDIKPIHDIFFLEGIVIKITHTREIGTVKVTRFRFLYVI